MAQLVDAFAKIYKQDGKLGVWVKQDEAWIPTTSIKAGDKIKAYRNIGGLAYDTFAITPVEGSVETVGNFIEVQSYVLSGSDIGKVVLSADYQMAGICTGLDESDVPLVNQAIDDDSYVIFIAAEDKELTGSYLDYTNKYQPAGTSFKAFKLED